MNHKDGRRQFLKSLGLLIGSTAAVQTTAIDKALAVAAAWEPHAGSPDADGQEFSRAELEILRHFCDQLIPRTDTPGATDVDSHGFVDNQVAHCYESDDRDRAHRALANMNRRAQDAHGPGFAACTSEQQLAILNDIEQGRNAENDGEIRELKFLKGLVAFGYFTSKAGATQELSFDPYPGGFTGSVPYASVGRSWFSG